MITAKDKQYALSYFDGRCAVCGNLLDGNPHKVNWDHWIPLSSAECPGTIPGNMIPLCSGCNHNKYAKHANDWLVDKHGSFLAETIQGRIKAFFETVRSAAPETVRNENGKIPRYVPVKPTVPKKPIRIQLNPLPEPPDMARRLSIIYDLAHKAYRDHMAQIANDSVATDVLAPTKKESDGSG